MVSAPRNRASEQDWSRAGAHNIVGVSFQIAVTAKLLVGSLAGELGMARATPEGFEDIDLEAAGRCSRACPGEGTCSYSAFRALGAHGRHAEEDDPPH